MARGSPWRRRGDVTEGRGLGRPGTPWLGSLSSPKLDPPDATAAASAAVAEQSQPIGEFVEWLHGQGIRLLSQRVAR